MQKYGREEVQLQLHQLTVTAHFPPKGTYFLSSHNSDHQNFFQAIPKFKKTLHTYYVMQRKEVIGASNGQKVCPSLVTACFHNCIFANCYIIYIMMLYFCNIVSSTAASITLQELLQSVLMTLLAHYINLFCSHYLGNHCMCPSC